MTVDTVYCRVSDGFPHDHLTEYELYLTATAESSDSLTSILLPQEKMKIKNKSMNPNWTTLTSTSLWK